ncbi:hypothetical protein [Segetibacter sp.]|jgi:hypothetical protein|uniref:hypothetical protein n=1 Tax=Segetibacter sp. TaxID=2231182 RepID=UPI002625D19A|nr:hypothetical protein [Segetibacter sp.]MCW3080032.1 hypothetical protein [Segetibacter sp.]
MNPKLSLIVFLLLGSLYTTAQQNSPFSRYGLGETSPRQNVISRAIGGIGSTYGNGQSVNFANPASYSDLKIVTYDIGITLDSRTLKSTSPVQKYSAINLTPAYVALGMPISKKHNLGLAFGLRPLTRIGYSIQENRRIAGSGRDSMLYIYEGDGGLYQGFVGIGKRWGGLRIGLNTGYMFGNKNNNTRAIPIDSMNTYKSNSATNTSFGSFFFNGGLQYDVNLSKTSFLRLGLAGNLRQNLKASQSAIRETFTYDANGTPITIDTVAVSPEVNGTINLPVSYTAGISINTSLVDRLGNRIDKSLIAVEYESTQWSNYRFFNNAERFNNSSLLKIGGQFTPNPLSLRSYWNRVTYRAGFYFGQEALTADRNKLPIYAVTLGAGLPVRKWRSFDNQYTIVNTTFEIGSRGNKNNNISEGFFRFSLGLNLSDVWFIKRKYE